jgi:hypothetical protein
MKFTPPRSAPLAVALLMLIGLARSSGRAAEEFVALPCPSNPALSCVMSGLDSPRGLAFGPEGGLYVVEAGRGGTSLLDPNDGFTFQGPMGGMSYGRTGAVTRLWRGHQEQVATGLPSISQPDGSRATGPQDIAFLGRGNAHVTVGLEGDPAFRETLAAAHPDFPEIAGLGRLIRVAASGVWRLDVDIAAYETANNPDGRLNEDGTPVHDSNPFGILAEPGRLLVTEAGGNALLQVDANGTISLLAVFHSRGTIPPRPSFAPPRPPPLPPFDEFTDAVPTTVIAGPDGAYYVAELTGVPFVDTRAKIYRVVAGDLAQTFQIDQACLTGFKMIIDMAFDNLGNLLVLQHATGAVQQGGAGVLIKVTPDLNQFGICSQYQGGTRTTLLANLQRPTSIAVGTDGSIYVSNRGTTPRTGEVVRVVQ